MYDIARYIPLEIRLDMAAVTYDQRDKKGRLQCADGKCPMGWLPDVGNDRPWSKEIADWVCEQRGTDDPELYEKVYTAAKEFTDDFDQGGIKDLAAALGVKRALSKAGRG